MTRPDDATDDPTETPTAFDFDPHEAAAKHEAKHKRGPKAKVPAWTSAIPANIDFDDPLELAATLGPAAVGIALVQVLHAVGIKPLTRASMVGQLAGQLKALVPTRRMWEAERAIRGEQAELEQVNPGPKLESNPLKDGARPQTDTATSRTKAVRGRPRKRSVL